MNKNFFIVILIFIVATVTAAGIISTRSNIKNRNLPDARSEYKVLIEKFTGFSQGEIVQGNILLSDGKYPDDIKENTSFELIKRGLSYLFKIGHVTTISDGDIFIKVDSINKHLFLLKSNPPSAISDNIGFPVILDSSAATTLEVFNINDNYRQLSFKSLDMPQIYSYLINYESKNYKINAMEIKWWKNSFERDTANADNFWITRLNYNYTPLIGPFEAKKEIQRYIKFDSGKMEVSEPYKNYQVIKQGF